MKKKCLIEVPPDILDQLPEALEWLDFIAPRDNPHAETLINLVSTLLDEIDRPDDGT